MIAATTSASIPCEAAPSALFARCAAAGGDAVLLESADGDGATGARSLLFTRCAVRIEARGREVALVPLTTGGAAAIGALAGELEDAAAVSLDGGRARISFEPGSAEGPLDVLRRATAKALRRGDDDEPLRAPGIFSYDFVSRFEALPAPAKDALGFPDFVFWLPEEEIVLDHPKGRARIAVHAYGRDGEAVPGPAIPGALERSVLEGAAVSGGAARRGEGRAGDAMGGGRVAVDIDDAAFEALVVRLKGHIAAGDVFQIVPSRTFCAPCADPFAAYIELCRANPSPYMFFARGPDFTLFGASPETCVRVGGDPREVVVRPIAGTRPRGRRRDGALDPELDKRLEAELRLDAKENAEHMMLVDLARNDVARVSEPGTRGVRALLDVARYSHVMHLESVVAGRLRAGLDALDVYAAVANMGTLVGAPKIEAARLLRLHERDARGPYGGAVGTLGSDGSLETAIVIRSAFVRDGRAFVRAGAGVVAGSDPAAEAAETRAKAAAPLEAVLRAEGGGR